MDYIIEYCIIKKNIRFLPKLHHIIYGFITIIDKVFCPLNVGVGNVVQVESSKGEVKSSVEKKEEKRKGKLCTRT